MSDISIGHSLSTWTDLTGFNALRQQAGQDSRAALPAVAKQFEAMFTQMMLKSMRDASPGDPELDSQDSNTWRDLYDQQLSLNLAQHGKGLGIADMLIRQLGANTHTKDSQAEAATSSAASDHASQDPAHPNTIAGGTPVADLWANRVLHVTDDMLQRGGQAVARWLPASATEFVRELAPHAMTAANKLGLSFRLLLAQAALETHWGRNIPADPSKGNSFNLFGIKAGSSWQGARVNVPTLEYENGVAVRRVAQFRAYASAQASFDDYANLIDHDPRYARVKGHGDDALSFAAELVNGGYATDPEYAAKVMAIANSPMMREALQGLKNLAPAPIQSTATEEN